MTHGGNERNDDRRLTADLAWLELNYLLTLSVAAAHRAHCPDVATTLVAVKADLIRREVTETAAP